MDFLEMTEANKPRPGRPGCLLKLVEENPEHKDQLIKLLDSEYSAEVIAKTILDLHEKEVLVTTMSASSIERHRRPGGCQCRKFL